LALTGLAVSRSFREKSVGARLYECLQHAAPELCVTKHSVYLR